MAAVKGARIGVAPRRCARHARAVPLLALLFSLLQGAVAKADPVALDAPVAVRSGDVSALAAGDVASRLTGDGPPMICEQLRGRGIERCRPVARLEPVHGSPEHHGTRGARAPVTEMAPASAAER